MRKRNAGFTAIDLLIAMLVIGTLATVAIVNIPAMFSTYDIELATTTVVDNVVAARRAALAGNPDSLKRTFDIKNAIPASHAGILVTTNPANGSSAGCRRGCSTGYLTLCISNENFCYTQVNNFEFERFTGEVNNGEQHVIFVISQRRQFAILISNSGNIIVAEQINGDWIAKSDLQSKS